MAERAVSRTIPTAYLPTIILNLIAGTVSEQKAGEAEC
jgi:hypothetical protein